ncbi:MAG TPA: outer membrane lipoprotein-sorting protein [Marinagarivorans sp.]
MKVLLSTLPRWALACALGLAAVNATRATADDAAQKGLTIASEVQNRDRGWGDSHATMEMILTNKQGRSSERKMEMKTLEVDGDGDKTLTIFHQPRDVEGTAFLSFSHALEPDQQWLYLPALKRVKRISSANKSGPFLGSEFAFEDLSSLEIEKYQYEYLRDDTLDGHPVFLVKYVPQYEHSGYQYLDVWIDQQEYIIRKIAFYDRKGAHLKTLDFTDFEQFNDKYWRAMKYVVQNHQTGKKTTLNWTEYTFDNGLDDSDFSQSALKRAR